MAFPLVTILGAAAVAVVVIAAVVLGVTRHWAG